MSSFPFKFIFDDPEKEAKMSNLQKKVLNQTIQLLIGMGCDFAIIDPSGEKHGNLDVIQKKKKVRVQEFHSYVSPILDKIAIGELLEVPPNEYKLEELQSNICARAYARWGAKSIATSINRKTNVIEVLRLK